MLTLKPTGENRLAYLHIKPGQVENIKEYIQKTWPEQFELIDPQQAVKAGLFGPGEPHPEIYNRIGDLIVAAKRKITKEVMALWPGSQVPVAIPAIKDSNRGITGRKNILAAMG